MVYLRLALILAGTVLDLVAVVGYALALRGGYHDAIGTSTLFDGRWIVGSFLLAAGIALTWHWSWAAAVGLVIAAYLAILPVKMLIRLLFARP